MLGARKKTYKDENKGYASTAYFDAWVEEEFEKILNEQIEEYEKNQNYPPPPPQYQAGKRRGATKRNKIKKNKTYKKH